MRTATLGLKLALLGAIASLACTAARAATVRTVYMFRGHPVDGSYPAAGLIAVGGTLYGTTAAGGKDGHGTIFSLAPATGDETLVHSFDAGPIGDRPVAALLEVGGVLYGTNQFHGWSIQGAVYSFDLTTGAVELVHRFGSKAIDGFTPRSSLTQDGAVSFGTTYQGGANMAGVVYALNPKTGAEETLYSFAFNATDGRYPQAALLNIHGLLYGTTTMGGQYGYGTVFTVDPQTGTEAVLHSFDRADGAGPSASVIAVDDTLYGTTSTGGTGDLGTVFALNRVTGAEQVLHSFAGGSDGANPVANLVDVSGTLYGTTSAGGSGPDCVGCGTVFAIKPRTGAETVIYAFQNMKDGSYPSAGLLYYGGALYGTTTYGGDTARCGSGCGTVFAITP